MTKKIAIIQGHPDASQQHLCHELANAYAMGAGEGGHEVRRIEIAEMNLPTLGSKKEWQGEVKDPNVRACQDIIAWADHWVIIYPLWLGTMPAMLKTFFEQTLRPDFAIASNDGWPDKLLKGKSARLIVTMGMPSFWYRLYYRSHSVKSVERNILQFCGIKPVRVSYFGLVDNARNLDQWRNQIHKLGVVAE